MASETHYFIEVRKKEGLPDGRAVAVLESAQDLGVEALERVQVGRLYVLQGQLSEDALDTVREELLCDPVAEEARVGEDHLPSFEGNLTVKVTYHPGVTDAVAATVREAIEQLGVRGVSQVATGTLYHLFLKKALPAQSIEWLCERLLANPVIQHYEVYDAGGRLAVKG